MTNNDILKRLRFTFNFTDPKIVKLFKLGGLDVTVEQVKAWTAKEEDEKFESLYDVKLASFLNGFIIDNRGQKGDETPKPEKSLTNNMKFFKLRIALALRDVDILEILALVDFKFSKSELNALFRKPGQSQYKPCKDQVLRNFLAGVHKRFYKEPHFKKPAPTSKKK